MEHYTIEGLGTGTPFYSLFKPIFSGISSREKNLFSSKPTKFGDTTKHLNFFHKYSLVGEFRFFFCQSLSITLIVVNWSLDDKWSEIKFNLLFYWWVWLSLFLLDNNANDFKVGVEEIKNLLSKFVSFGMKRKRISIYFYLQVIAVPISLLTAGSVTRRNRVWFEHSTLAVTATSRALSSC